MTRYDPSQHLVVHSLIAEFASVARHLHASGDFDESLGRITATAKQTLSGCEAASISLIAEGGPVTFGATDPMALDGDQIQYDEREGPCMDAALQESWVSTPDLTADPRWPRSAARLSEQLGVRSMFSCRMALEASPQKSLGGLNLYATTPRAFTAKDQMLAILLSSLGAVVVDAVRQQEQLRAAIASRQVIGEAVGMLRVQSDLTSNQAFAMLSRASQRANVKLRDLAKQISDGSRTGRNGYRTPQWENVPQQASSLDPFTSNGFGAEVVAKDREAALDDRERDADARDGVADGRDDIAANREAVLDHREAVVRALLSAADMRDRLAEVRDRRADERDGAANSRPFTSQEDYAAAAALDRGLSSVDRYESGVDRDRSAGDRAELIALPRWRPRRQLDDHA